MFIYNKTYRATIMSCQNFALYKSCACHHYCFYIFCKCVPHFHQNKNHVHMVISFRSNKFSFCPKFAWWSSWNYNIFKIKFIVFFTVFSTLHETIIYSKLRFFFFLKTVFPTLKRAYVYSGARTSTICTSCYFHHLQRIHFIRVPKKRPISSSMVE